MICHDCGLTVSCCTGVTDGRQLYRLCDSCMKDWMYRHEIEIICGAEIVDGEAYLVVIK